MKGRGNENEGKEGKETSDKSRFSAVTVRLWYHVRGDAVPDACRLEVVRVGCSAVRPVRRGNSSDTCETAEGVRIHPEENRPGNGRKQRKRRVKQNGIRKTTADHGGRSETPRTPSRGKETKHGARHGDARHGHRVLQVPELGEERRHDKLDSRGARPGVRLLRV